MSVQVGNLLLYHCKRSPLVSHWPRPDGLFHDLVLIRFPEYRFDHRDICNRQSVLMQAYQYCWLCTDLSTASHVLLCLLYDDSGYCSAPDPVAAEGRGSR